MDIFNSLVGQIILGILVVINLSSFFIMGNDKRKSTRTEHVRRMPEGLIFFWATMFGSIGVYAGMILFRHKTRKWYFKIGIPMLIVQNVALVYVVWQLYI